MKNYVFRAENNKTYHMSENHRGRIVSPSGRTLECFGTSLSLEDYKLFEKTRVSLGAESEEILSKFYLESLKKPFYTGANGVLFLYALSKDGPQQGIVRNVKYEATNDADDPLSSDDLVSLLGDTKEEEGDGKVAALENLTGGVKKPANTPTIKPVAKPQPAKKPGIKK